MTNTQKLIQRNEAFARTFSKPDLPIIPKFRSVVLACGDARVDPAHILNLELGDSVVIRNNGARVTEEFINELATLTFMVANMDGDNPGPFELILLHHTQCGAERFADPQFQAAIQQNLGIDLSDAAIYDHEDCIRDDIQRLRDSEKIPDHVTVSGYLYDVKSGIIREVSAPSLIRE